MPLLQLPMPSTLGIHFVLSLVSMWTGLIRKLWINFHEIFVIGKPWQETSVIFFGGSDLDMDTRIFHFSTWRNKLYISELNFMLSLQSVLGLLQNFLGSHFWSTLVQVLSCSVVVFCVIVERGINCVSECCIWVGFYLSTWSEQSRVIIVVFSYFVFKFSFQQLRDMFHCSIQISTGAEVNIEKLCPEVMQCCPRVNCTNEGHNFSVLI